MGIKDRLFEAKFKSFEKEFKAKQDENIAKHQKEMFRNTLFNSALIGLGAFFITNLIPSAFELSIFVFEIIAFLSPLTIDRFVLKIKPPQV